MQFFVNGEKVRYNPYNMKKDKFIGGGTEFDAYRIGDKAVKFLKRHPGKEILLTKEAVDRMSKIETKRILLPTDVLLDKKHRFKGYQMDYIEDLGKDSYFNLDKNKLKEENKLLSEDIELLSNNKLLIGDLISQNTVYNNGLYLIDPGSYRFNYDIDSNQAYRINIERINTYLVYEVLLHYHLNKYNESRKFAASYIFSNELSREYDQSEKDDVLKFLSEIEENNLDEFVSERVNGRKH